MGRGAAGVGGPGDDRLSRQGHYHGPGGLNGRVRDGNGCGPASIVAGESAGGRSGHAGRVVSDRRSVGHAGGPGREVRVGGGGCAISRRTRVAGCGDTSGRLVGHAGVRASASRGRGGAGRGGQAARLLGPVGCGGRPPCTPGLSTWSSSRSLRCLVAPGNLVSEGASRLDAFSAYPVPTWLPGDAPSGTAGTPEVGPPQSSRTRGDAPQVSYAHGR